MAECFGIQVVVNPVAGSAGSRRVLDELCRRIRDAGWSVRIQATQGPGDARKVAAGCRREEVRALVVAGGDGTVSQVAAGIADGGVPILVVPGGTENIVAKYLRTRLDAEWLWNILRQGREVAFDLPAMNGRRFLILAGIGFDAEVAHRLARDRVRHITHLSYFWPTWRTYWNHRFARLSVEADGAPLYEGPGLVFVGSLPRYAGGLRILHHARPDDALLDVCILQCRRRSTLWRHALNIFLRRHIGGGSVVYRQARHVRVRPAESALNDAAQTTAVPVQLDGDPAGSLPADFEMTPHQARFLVAADWST
jgi:YegS/Rv2252/BmrU family lipid kinase